MLLGVLEDLLLEGDEIIGELGFLQWDCIDALLDLLEHLQGGVLEFDLLVEQLLILVVSPH